MTQDNENEVFAKQLENAVDNPEETARRIQKKSGVKPGVFSVIWDFIKSYNAKDAGVSDEAWLADQFAKPDYTDAFSSQDERVAVAKGIVQGVEDYENAKKSLRSHIEDLHGSRESWLARQINIGAEANNEDPAKYADEIAKGLEDAVIENAALVLDDGEAE